MTVSRTDYERRMAVIHRAVKDKSAALLYNELNDTYALTVDVPMRAGPTWAVLILEVTKDPSGLSRFFVPPKRTETWNVQHVER